MQIGLFDGSWWGPACETLGLKPLSLPVARGAGENVYAADLAGRLRNGAAIVESLRGQTAEFLLDHGGNGLGLLAESADHGKAQLAHEAAGRILCSHFVDPLTTSFQGLDWAVAWQCLRSRTWVKAVWDLAQAAELQRFGVANVVHLPMAAPDRAYDQRPIDPAVCRTAVSFVGGQNTNYFRTGVTVPTSDLLAGTIAHPARTDLGTMSFAEIYHDLYQIGEWPREGEDLGTQVAKTVAYFRAKLFFHAALCIRHRDRFVIFLKRKLGDTFRLIGRGWDQAYGLTAEPPLASYDQYLQHFRETAININLINGNAETGLNMRAFEITAAGGFLLCYHQPELDQYFEVGKECAAFRNEADLLDKIHHYLQHPDERTAIAQAGQRRTLGGHLYSHRLARLLEALDESIVTSSRASVLPVAGRPTCAASAKC